MKKICLLTLVLITSLVIGITSGTESKSENQTSENIIDYGNGVYYINCANPEVIKTRAGNIDQEKEYFGKILSNLIKENPGMETDIIVPYQEVGYTKGYYVILQKI